MVHESVDDRLRVALVSPSTEQRRVLADHLAANGLETVDVLDGAAFEFIGPGVADVLLVNLDDDGDEAVDIEALLDRAEIPVLFNDADAMRRQSSTSIAGQAWGRRLADKLQALVRGGEPQTFPSSDGAPAARPAAAVPPVAGARPAPAGELAPGAAPEVWVLAASIGGPQALAEFLQHLRHDLPVGLVVAQHIGAGFADLLATQLARVTPLAVRCGEHDMVLGPGEVAVAPVEQRFGFSQPGRIALAPEMRRSIYSPCIDDVMTAVAEAYGARAGAVIFSGMGSDGVVGGRAIAAVGGAVFAQEPRGCVVSSMADGAREAGIVSFTGTPAELARHFLERFGGCCDESMGSQYT